MRKLNLTAEQREEREKKQACIRNRRYYFKNIAKIAEKRSAPENLEYRRKYYKENSETILAQLAIWREENKDTKAETDRRYRDKNKAVLSIKKADYYSENQDKIQKQMRENYKVNQVAYVTRVREWRRANPDKVYEMYARRRALKKGATVEKVDRREVYLRDKGICGICGLPIPLEEVTLDHIIPLSKGGEHSYRNIQLAHLSCNSAKGAKIINL